MCILCIICTMIIIVPFVQNLAKLFSYLWKPNCLYPPQQTIICLFVHFSQKRHTIICLFVRFSHKRCTIISVFALNLLPQKFPQYRNGSNGFPTDRIWRFGITLRIFRERRPAVIFTIGKVVHNGQLGLVWLIHWNWDRFLECHIFPNHCDIFKDFPVLPGQKENFRNKFGQKTKSWIFWQTLQRQMMKRSIWISVQTIFD